MKRCLLALLAVSALASLVVLSVGLSSRMSGTVAGAAAAPAAAPPWETAGPYPSSYDLRTAVPGYTTLSPVRQQQNWSTCWIMAATGALESATIMREGTTPLYSPNNLADHMASRLDYEGMAPSELAAAYYARWEGPVLESQDPYPRKDLSPTYLRAVRHLQEVLFLPRRTPGASDNDAVKWAVMTYGGVDAAAYFHIDERGFWNGETSSYYSDASGDLNHHILCVGWDDAYPATDFGPPRPPGDGAFLIKNSWGAGFGRSGYLWLSYYDANFGKALAVFDGVEAVDDYDAIYQYDALGRSDWISAGADQSAWYANRFTCAGSGEVKAVSFYTPVPGTDYEVRVAATVGGVAGAADVATGSVAVGGYHTITLAQPATVKSGERFVVAVHVTAPGASTPVPVEAPSQLIAPRARAGQSYLSADGSSWSDLTSLKGMARANVCLKAFVDSTGGADGRAPYVDVSGGTVRRGGTAGIRWRLIDPAFSCASAIVLFAVTDADDRVVVRRRVPAVAVGERGTWGLKATWPAGRYTVRAKAFDVAGNRSATSRAWVLVRGSAAPTRSPASARH